MRQELLLIVLVIYGKQWIETFTLKQEHTLKLQGQKQKYLMSNLSSSTNNTYVF